MTLQCGIGFHDIALANLLLMVVSIVAQRSKAGVHIISAVNLSLNSI